MKVDEIKAELITFGVQEEDIKGMLKPALEKLLETKRSELAQADNTDTSDGNDETQSYEGGVTDQSNKNVGELSEGNIPNPNLEGQNNPIQSPIEEIIPEGCWEDENGVLWEFKLKTPEKFRYNGQLKSKKEWLEDSEAMASMTSSNGIYVQRKID